MATTVQKRINYWQGRSDYLGHQIDASLINYKNNGTSVEVTLTIYTQSGNTAIERMEKWIIPNADITSYLTKDAYKRSFTLSSKASYTLMFHHRRWFR